MSQLPVKLQFPENITSLGLTPYTYTWYSKLSPMLDQICPGYNYEWAYNNGKWIPDFLYVDEDTALYLILKHEFKRA